MNLQVNKLFKKSLKNKFLQNVDLNNKMKALLIDQTEEFIARLKVFTNICGNLI
jgi:hypothetical protein